MLDTSVMSEENKEGGFDMQAFLSRQRAILSKFKQDSKLKLEAAEAKAREEIQKLEINQKEELAKQ